MIVALLGSEEGGFAAHKRTRILVIGSNHFPQESNVREAVSPSLIESNSFAIGS